MKRLLVTGPRTWVNWLVLIKAFDDAWDYLGQPEPEDITLVTGMADGLDFMAYVEACKRDWKAEPVFPNWYPDGIYDKTAGHKRNQLMVDRGAHLSLAFLLKCDRAECPKRGRHWTHGTENCIGKIEETSIELWRYRG
jgi:hypothetical protein